MVKSDVRVELLGPLRSAVDGAAVEVPGAQAAGRPRAPRARRRPHRPRRRTSWTRCGLPRCRTRPGQASLHTHISPAARLSRVRRRAAGRPARTATASISAATSSTSRTRGPSPRARNGAGPGGARAPAGSPRAVAGPLPRRPHRRRTDRRGRRGGCDRPAPGRDRPSSHAAVDAGRSDDVVGLAAAARRRRPAARARRAAVDAHARRPGQAAEALRVGHDDRRRLADETGLDPSPALGELNGTSRAAPSDLPPVPPQHVRGRRPACSAGNPSRRRCTACWTSERLVTVVGAGGVGKTRVALEVARRSDATTVLLLAPVTDPAAIPHALAVGAGTSTWCAGTCSPPASRCRWTGPAYW